jgi:excisionase family DNA binding protein
MPPQRLIDQIGFSTTEAAAKLGLNPVTVQRWIRRGRIRAMKVGGPIGYRIPAVEVSRLLNTLSSSRSDELREIAFKVNDLAGLALAHVNDLQELGLEGHSHASEMSDLRSAAGLLEEVASRLAEEAGAVDVSPPRTSDR